ANVNLTPAWYLVIVGFGFLFIFGLLGIYFCYKNKKLIEDKYLFLIIWLVIQFILIYSPFNFQRRTIQGLQLPLVIFTVIALIIFKTRVKDIFIKRYLIENPAALLILFVLLFCVSNLSNIASDLYYFTNQNHYFYWPREEIEAMKWLADNTTEEVVVLCHPNSGNILPGIAGRTVYLGHSVETVDFQAKKDELIKFFTEYNDQKRMKFLKEENITHLYYGLKEQEVASSPLKANDYLREVYKNLQVTIYQVL
ncbi:MAG: hypothetical protein ACTSQY_11720, partial [Candidatus Odinarchaeia archaeon]